MPKKKRGLGIDNLLGGLEESNKTIKQVNKKKIKRTFEISEETDLLLEKIKFNLRTSGQKITKNELIEEAIKLLAKKYNIS